MVAYVSSLNLCFACFQMKFPFRRISLHFGAMSSRHSAWVVWMISHALPGGRIKRPVAFFANSTLSTPLLLHPFTRFHTHNCFPLCLPKSKGRPERLPPKDPRPRVSATIVMLSMLTDLPCRKRGRGRPPKRTDKNPFIDDAASDDERYLSIFSGSPPTLMCRTAPLIFLKRKPALLGIQ